jgi:hypothetical protein
MLHISKYGSRFRDKVDRSLTSINVESVTPPLKGIWGKQAYWDTADTAVSPANLADLAGRASKFSLPGKLVELAYRPSREIAVSLLDRHRAGGFGAITFRLPPSAFRL